MMQKSDRSDLQQTGTSKSEQEGPQQGSETSYAVQAGDGGTDKKTGGGAGSGRGKKKDSLWE